MNTLVIVLSVIYALNSIVTIGVALITTNKKETSRKHDAFLICWTIATITIPAIVAFVLMLVEIATNI